MGAVENIKEVADLIKKFNDIDLNRGVLNLENEVLDLSRDKRRADDRIEQLQQALAFKEKLTFVEPFYFLEGDGTPYCAGCWESSRNAIHVTLFFEGNIKHEWHCPVCKHKYFSPKEATLQWRSQR